MAAGTLPAPTLGAATRRFYDEAKDAKKASEVFPEGSEGRQVLTWLSGACGRMGARFERHSGWGRSIPSLRASLVLEVEMYKYGEDPDDMHPPQEKQWARQQLLVVRLGLKRLDEIGGQARS